jgi:hypothetical protein
MSRLEPLRLAGLLAIFAAQLFLGGRIAGVARFDYCFTKPFWLDEFHTLELVRQERAGQLLSKLAHGGDSNPPGLPLTLWALSKVTNCSDEVLFRSFSCAVGLCGLAATYFLLRLRFAWPVAWVAVLGLWSSSPLLIEQMFEGRFYSFWFAAAAGLCLLLGLRATGLWRFVGVAAVAALMCSIHYFAIIALGLITVSQFCCNFRDSRQRRLTATALAAGIVALVALLPFYFGQRAALPVPTWIDPPTLRGSAAFLDVFGLTYALSVPVLAYAFQELAGFCSDKATSTDGLEFHRYAGACGLLLLPLAIVVFSYVIQPAEIARYALPAVLAYAPLIALIARRLNGGVLAALALVFFVAGLRGPVVVYRGMPSYRELAPIARAASVEWPLVVHSRHVAYPLVRYTGVNPQVVRISFLFRGQEDKLGRLDRLEQVVTRRMAELFDLPKTLEPNELASLDEFYLAAEPGEERRYKGWTAEPTGLVVDSLRAYKMKRTH